MIPPLSTYSSTEPLKFKIESKNLVDKNFEGDFEHPNLKYEIRVASLKIDNL
jgi:hypothetical protein